ncbi:hypothetical protein BDV96DRAFT_581224 [Lophiotrema nucula]|uniref:SprT-like domain-containing protein n=1 Tax=Lophiotrema nucula TaxID=690887 RepID=A0A6A5YZW6_9PLEO|nr:hypothetical protein BDV96DRAFT_581224 [Lophiotrema nucula]
MSSNKKVYFNKPAVYSASEEKDGKRIITEATWEFRYERVPSQNGGYMAGLSSGLGNTICIRIDPVKGVCPYIDLWGMELISMLLHEVIHAFFDKHACRECNTYKQNNNANGHGRSWQLVAPAVEDVFLREFGLPVDLCRWESYVNNRDGIEELPSVHDLSIFRFEHRLTEFGDYTAVRHLVKRTMQLSYCTPSYGGRAERLPVNVEERKPEGTCCNDSRFSGRAGFDM